MDYLRVVGYPVVGYSILNLLNSLAPSLLPSDSHKHKHTPPGSSPSLYYKKYL